MGSFSRTLPSFHLIFHANVCRPMNMRWSDEKGSARNSKMSELRRDISGSRLTYFLNYYCLRFAVREEFSQGNGTHANLSIITLPRFQCAMNFPLVHIVVSLDRISAALMQGAYNDEEQGKVADIQNKDVLFLSTRHPSSKMCRFLHNSDPTLGKKEPGSRDVDSRNGDNRNFELSG